MIRSSALMDGYISFMTFVDPSKDSLQFDFFLQMCFIFSLLVVLIVLLLIIFKRWLCIFVMYHVTGIAYLYGELSI